MLSAGEVTAYVLLDLAIILAAARLVGALFVKLKQPRVVGEIIAGILIGPTVIGGELATRTTHGSGLVNRIFPQEAFGFLDIIATVSLVLFMFLIGLEIEQRYFRGRGKQIIALGLAVTVVPFLIGFPLAKFLNDPGTWRVLVTPEGKHVAFSTHALFVGAGLAVTAFPVMARILQEKHMLDTDMGAIAIGAAALSLPLMFLMIAGAFASGPRGVFDDVSVKLGLALAFVAVLFLVVRPLLRLILARRFVPGRPLDGDLYAMLLVGAFLAGYAADRIGIQALNGGFLFGACVPQVEGLSRAISDRMQQFVLVLLLPILLAVSGLQTNLRTFHADDIVGGLVFLAAMIVAKWGVATLVGRGLGLTWPESNTVGVLMNCRGLEILIVALIGRQAGVLTNQMMVVFVAGAVVTTLMTAPLFDRFVSKERADEVRDNTLLGGITPPPAATADPRVLVVPGEPAFAAAAIDSAGRFVDGNTRPRFLVAEPVPLPGDDGYGGTGMQDQPLAISETLGWLEPIADSLTESGGHADTSAFSTADRAADLTRLAKLWSATDAIAGAGEDAEALIEAGLSVTMLHPPLEEAA